MEGFWRYDFGVAYTWRGLFLEFDVMSIQYYYF